MKKANNVPKRRRLKNATKETLELEDMKIKLLKTSFFDFLRFFGSAFAIFALSIYIEYNDLLSNKHLSATNHKIAETVRTNQSVDVYCYHNTP